jgi:ribosome-associated translation inhibitor RaiA
VKLLLYRAIETDFDKITRTLNKLNKRTKTITKYNTNQNEKEEDSSWKLENE